MHGLLSRLRTDRPLVQHDGGIAMKDLPEDRGWTGQRLKRNHAGRRRPLAGGKGELAPIRANINYRAEILGQNASMLGPREYLVGDQRSQQVSGFQNLSQLGYARDC
jgi:hypothetical protein